MSRPVSYTHLDVYKRQGVQYSYLVFSAMKEGDSFRVSREGAFLDADKIVNLYVITLDEYNGAAGANASLSDGEILLYDSQGDYDASSLKLFDREYQVKACLVYTSRCV